MPIFMYECQAIFTDSHRHVIEQLHIVRIVKEAFFITQTGDPHCRDAPCNEASAEVRSSQIFNVRENNTVRRSGTLAHEDRETF